jgi:DNA polymerase-3 subunit delta
MTTPIRIEQLYAAWAEGRWKPVYLFAGSEDFLIEEATLKLCTYRLGQEDNHLNRDCLDGETHSVGDILAAGQTVPFLGRHRLVEVQNVSRFGPDEQEQLVQAMALLPTTTTLLLIWGKEWRRDDVNKPLVEGVLQRGDVVIFWPLFPDQAQRWLLDRAARRYKKTLAPEAAAWLVQQAGEGLRVLDQELFKASLFVGNRPSLQLEDVQAAFGYDKASSPYEWTNALRQKSGPRALQTLRRLLEAGEEPLRLMALISGALRDWLYAKNSGESTEVLAMRLRLKRGEENRFFQELQRWSEEQLTEGISACLESEQSIKTGKETPEIALTLLSLRLCDLEALQTLR